MTIQMIKMLSECLLDYSEYVDMSRRFAKSSGKIWGQSGKSSGYGQFLKHC